MSREVLQTKLHVYFAHKDPNKNSDPNSFQSIFNWKKMHLHVNKHNK